MGTEELIDLMSWRVSAGVRAQRISEDIGARIGVLLPDTVEPNGRFWGEASTIEIAEGEHCVH